MLFCVRVAEVAREHGWHPLKSLDSDENFKPELTLFCRELGFVAIYALFGDLWVEKVPFLAKNSVSWARSALFPKISTNRTKSLPNLNAVGLNFTIDMNWEGLVRLRLGDS